MKDLGNKLLLYIIGSHLLWFAGLNPLTIAAFALALASSSLCTYLGNSKTTCVLLWCYSFLCIPYPEFGVYLPLLLYDACRYSPKYTLPPILAAGIYAGLHFHGFLVFPYICATIISALLSFFSGQIDSLHRQLHQMEDESKEVTLALKERNRALIEKQNYEIHIATLSERNRIAREIHDNVGHLLTRSILQTGALKVINRDPVLNEPLSTLNDTLNTAMTSIRASVHDLHDEAIDLSCVLTDIISHVDKPAIRLEYDMDEPVPREIKYAVIAIVKEAVNNMQKHSNATSAHITVREHPAFYRLQIEDNGTAKKHKCNHGIGLSNMEERIAALGGTIRFSTENGFGIFITIMKKTSVHYKTGKE